MDGYPTTLVDQQKSEESRMNYPSADPYSVQAALDALLQIQAEQQPKIQYCDRCLKPCRVGPGYLCRSCHRLEHSEREEY